MNRNNIYTQYGEYPYFEIEQTSEGNFSIISVEFNQKTQTENKEKITYGLKLDKGNEGEINSYLKGFISSLKSKKEKGTNFIENNSKEKVNEAIILELKKKFSSDFREQEDSSDGLDLHDMTSNNDEKTRQRIQITNSKELKSNLFNLIKKEIENRVNSWSLIENNEININLNHYFNIKGHGEESGTLDFIEAKFFVIDGKLQLKMKYIFSKSGKKYSQEGEFNMKGILTQLFIVTNINANQKIKGRGKAEVEEFSDSINKSRKKRIEDEMIEFIMESVDDYLNNIDTQRIYGNDFGKMKQSKVSNTFGKIKGFFGFGK